MSRASRAFWRGAKPSRRDALAVRLCNLILRLLASEDYRRRLTAVIWRGLGQTEGDER